jgi:hypothetical protein
MPRYEDGNGRVRWTRNCYVIELDPGACSDRRSSCLATMSRKHRPVYVGETALTPEERLEQHMSGVRSSRWVRNYNVRLRPDLAPAGEEFDTVEEARLAEKKLGARLAADGFCVYGAH